MPAKSAKDIAWLAGWLEGEGSFGCKEDGTAPYIVSGCTDLDVVLRYASVVGGKNKIQVHHSNGKPMYKFRVDGNLAIQWMMTILPLMGERRSKRISQCLEYWKARPLIVDRQDKREIGDLCRQGHHLIGNNARESISFGKKYVNCKICQYRTSKRSRDQAYRDRLLKEQESYNAYTQ